MKRGQVAHGTGNHFGHAVQHFLNDVLPVNGMGQRTPHQGIFKQGMAGVIEQNIVIMYKAFEK